MSDEYPMGSLCHLEIPAPDLVRAQAFYGEVFGWTFHPISETYVIYRDGKNGGGLDKDKKVSGDAGPTPVLAVDSIEATLPKIEEWGGKAVTPKTDIGGGMGFYAYFEDPNGNKVGIWSEA